MTSSMMDVDDVLQEWLDVPIEQNLINHLPLSDDIDSDLGFLDDLSGNPSELFSCAPAKLQLEIPSSLVALSHILHRRYHPKEQSQTYNSLCAICTKELDTKQWKGVIPLADFDWPICNVTSTQKGSCGARSNFKNWFNKPNKEVKATASCALHNAGEVCPRERIKDCLTCKRAIVVYASRQMPWIWEERLKHTDPWTATSRDVSQKLESCFRDIVANDLKSTCSRQNHPGKRRFKHQGKDIELEIGLEQQIHIHEYGNQTSYHVRRSRPCYCGKMLDARVDQLDSVDACLEHLAECPRLSHFIGVVPDDDVSVTSADSGAAATSSDSAEELVDSPPLINKLKRPAMKRGIDSQLRRAPKDPKRARTVHRQRPSKSLGQKDLTDFVAGLSPSQRDTLISAMEDNVSRQQLLRALEDERHHRTMLAQNVQPSENTLQQVQINADLDEIQYMLQGMTDVAKYTLANQLKLDSVTEFVAGFKHLINSKLATHSYDMTNGSINLNFGISMIGCEQESHNGKEWAWNKLLSSARSQLHNIQARDSAATIVVDEIKSSRNIDENKVDATLHITEINGEHACLGNETHKDIASKIDLYELVQQWKNIALSECLRILESIKELEQSATRQQTSQEQDVQDEQQISQQHKERLEEQNNWPQRLVQAFTRRLQSVSAATWIILFILGLLGMLCIPNSYASSTISLTTSSFSNIYGGDTPPSRLDADRLDFSNGLDDPWFLNHDRQSETQFPLDENDSNGFWSVGNVAKPMYSLLSRMLVTSVFLPYASSGSCPLNETVTLPTTSWLSGFISSSVGQPSVVTDSRDVRGSSDRIKEMCDEDDPSKPLSDKKSPLRGHANAQYQTKHDGTKSNTRKDVKSFKDWKNLNPTTSLTMVPLLALYTLLIPGQGLFSSSSHVPSSLQKEDTRSQISHYESAQTQKVNAGYQIQRQVPLGRGSTLFQGNSQQYQSTSNSEANVPSRESVSHKAQMQPTNMISLDVIQRTRKKRKHDTSPDALGTMTIVNMLTYLKPIIIGEGDVFGLAQCPEPQGFHQFSQDSRCASACQQSSLVADKLIETLTSLCHPSNLQDQWDDGGLGSGLLSTHRKTHIAVDSLSHCNFQISSQLVPLFSLPTADVKVDTTLRRVASNVVESLAYVAGESLAVLAETVENKPQVDTALKHVVNAVVDSLADASDISGDLVSRKTGSERIEKHEEDERRGAFVAQEQNQQANNLDTLSKRKASPDVFPGLDVVREENDETKMRLGTTSPTLASVTTTVKSVRGNTGSREHSSYVLQTDSTEEKRETTQVFSYQTSRPDAGLGGFVTQDPVSRGGQTNRVELARRNVASLLRTPVRIPLMEPNFNGSSQFPRGRGRRSGLRGAVRSAPQRQPNTSFDVDSEQETNLDSRQYQSSHCNEVNQEESPSLTIGGDLLLQDEQEQTKIRRLKTLASTSGAAVTRPKQVNQQRLKPASLLTANLNKTSQSSRTKERKQRLGHKTQQSPMDCGPNAQAKSDNENQKLRLLSQDTSLSRKITHEMDFVASPGGRTGIGSTGIGSADSGAAGDSAIAKSGISLVAVAPAAAAAASAGQSQLSDDMMDCSLSKQSQGSCHSPTKLFDFSTSSCWECYQSVLKDKMEWYNSKQLRELFLANCSAERHALPCAASGCSRGIVSQGKRLLDQDCGLIPPPPPTPPSPPILQACSPSCNGFLNEVSQATDLENKFAPAEDFNTTLDRVATLEGDVLTPKMNLNGFANVNTHGLPSPFTESPSSLEKQKDAALGGRRNLKINRNWANFSKI
eukprot:m.87318 g.87318  ORF g.87318 m.87318 type:complete len:1783 (-) comp13101_c2_seq1:196-5544(-)